MKIKLTEMKQLKSLCNNKNLLFLLLLLLCSCRYNDIEYKAEKCYRSGDTLVSLSDLYPEDWDTLYYFSNVYSLGDIEEQFGLNIGMYYQDVGDRMVLVKNHSSIVYYKEWFSINYGQKYEGVFIDAPDLLVVPRNKTTFLIRKIDEDLLDFIYQDSDTITTFNLL